MLRCLKHGALKVEEEEPDPRQPGVERLTVNSGDLALARGLRLKCGKRPCKVGRVGMSKVILYSPYKRKLLVGGPRPMFCCRLMTC